MYFLVGVEVGVAVIGMVVLAGLQARRIHGQNMMNRLKSGGAS